MVKVTMTFRTISLLAMLCTYVLLYNMFQVSDIGPSWPFCFIYLFICCFFFCFFLEKLFKKDTRFHQEK